MAKKDTHKWFDQGWSPRKKEIKYGTVMTRITKREYARKTSHCAQSEQEWPHVTNREKLLDLRRYEKFIVST